MDQTAKTNQDLLLVIDMQNVYTKGQEWACEEVEKASDSILRLLNSRALSQVIFTQYLATKHPEGVWKEYNKVNAAVNAYHLPIPHDFYSIFDDVPLPLLLQPIHP